MNDSTKKKPIFVTQSILPPLGHYVQQLEKIFQSNHLTNNGQCVLELEQKLSSFLELPFTHLCANGTMGLQLAIRALGLEGKKIFTTPFSYVATLSALLWEGCEPIFVDIDPQTLCLSPKALREAAIQHPDAAGIMPVHVYGNACDVDEINAICKDFNLLCIYDAAHAFGVKYKGKSLFSYGDISVSSFHATKLFHTVEGGGIFCNNEATQEKLALLKSFGHAGDNHFCLGINSKMSELHAAMGLCLLPQIPSLTKQRKKLFKLYNAALSIDSPNSLLRHPVLLEGLEWNYAFYPIIFPHESILLYVKNALEKEDIFPRRYFYPSLTTLPYVKNNPCPVADNISKAVLCLPFYANMKESTLNRIVEIISKSIDAYH